jgi:hypothetical protein
VFTRSSSASWRGVLPPAATAPETEVKGVGNGCAKPNIPNSGEYVNADALNGEGKIFLDLADFSNPDSAFFLDGVQFQKSLVTEGLLIKATVKKTITVPAYTRSDGTFVPEHKKSVLYDPDKDKKDIVSGNGNYTQKQAHKKLSEQIKDFSKLPEEHQYAHILSSATNIQDKKSFGATISKLKAALAAGTLTAAQKNKAREIFKKLAETDAAKAKLFLDMMKQPDIAPVSSAEEDAKPEEKPDLKPESQAPKDGPKEGETKVVNGVTSAMKNGRWHVEDVEEKHLFGYLAGVLDAKGETALKVAAEKWLEKHPGKDPVINQELSDLETDIKVGNGKTSGQIYKEQAKENEAAQKLKEIEDGKGGYLPGKAYKKLSAAPEWKSASAVEKLENIDALAKEMQDTQTANANVSKWKKTAMEGKNPAKGLWLQYGKLAQEKQKALFDEVKAAVGTTAHLKPLESIDWPKDTPEPAPPQKQETQMKQKVLHTFKHGKKTTATFIQEGDELIVSSDYGFGDPADEYAYPMEEYESILSSFKEDGYTEIDADGNEIKEEALPEAPASAEEPPATEDAPKEGDTKMIDGKMYVLKNGRWHLMGKDDGKKEIEKKVEDKEPAAKKVAEKQTEDKELIGGGKSQSKYSGAVVMDGWKQTGEQQGSNPGGKYVDPHGQAWYCKFPSDQDRARNELLAGKFYEMLGVKAARLRLVEKDGKLGIASRWQNGLKKAAPGELAGAKSAFAIDAWLANWDVVGLGYDNLLMSKEGVFRVDAGGALLYRAQGTKKGGAFGKDVPELETLLDPQKNGQAHSVFKGVTKEEMQFGLEQLSALSPSQIRTLVDMIGPGDAVEKTQLSDLLIARRNFILEKFGVRDQWDFRPPDLTKLSVDPKDLPSPIDFFHHPEKGGTPLSSVEWVNAQNTKDSQALVVFASQGNLLALKDYSYEAVDKSTGQSQGKKPITDHPSHHIKQQWAELVELLQSISVPKLKTLALPVLTVIEGMRELGEVLASIDPTYRTETVSVEKKMGFFMKIDQVDGVEELAAQQEWKYIAKNSSFVKKCKEGFKNFSGTFKTFISNVQDSGWVNHVFSQGMETVKLSGSGGSYDGGIHTLAHEVYKNAVEIPEGTILKRGMKDVTAGKSMTKMFLEAKPGLVIQNVDSMCASYNESHGWGGDIQMTIRCVKGAKGIPSFASGHYQKEYEITTLPGARFVLLKSEKKGGITHIDVLMLPPSEAYLAELDKLASLGKAFS